MLTRSRRLVSRLQRVGQVLVGPVELHMPQRGALSSLVVQAQRESDNVALLSEEVVRLQVHAVGLNFRDVLNVMGEYPGDPGPPGSDCAGVVKGVGSLVSRLAVDDRVFGCSSGCLQGVGWQYVKTKDKRWE